MATISTLGTPVWNTSTGTHSLTATPAVGDLIVIVCGNTGIVTNPTVTDNNADGQGTYTQITSCLWNTSASKGFAYIRDHQIGSATSTSFSVTGASSTGGGLTVMKITNMPSGKVGSAGAKSSGKQDNQAAGTPAPALGAACRTQDPVFSGVFNVTNPGGVTARGTPAYTRANNSGFNSPVTGQNTMWISSGETATTITWGSASASVFGSLVVEVDTDLTGDATITLGNATIAGQGKVDVKGSLTKTLDSASVAGTAKVTAGGALAKTLDGATVAGTGLVTSGPTGALSVTLGNASIAGTAKVPLNVSLTKTLDSATMAGAGKVFISGVLTKVLDSATVAGTANVTNTVRTGNLSRTLDSATVQGLGDIPLNASLTKTLGNVTLAGTGTVLSPSIGTLSVTLGNVTLAGTGHVFTPGPPGVSRWPYVYGGTWLPYGDD